MYGTPRASATALCGTLPLYVFTPVTKYGSSAIAPFRTFSIVQDGALYGDRLNQLDFRAGKILKFGKTRTAVNLDLFNAFNRNTALTLNNNFASWQQPLSIERDALGRYSILLDGTAVVLRPDVSAAFVGLPYSAK